MSRRFVGHPTFARVLQYTDYTCAPCCVAALLKHFDRPALYPLIRIALETGFDGTDQGPILRYLRRRGFVARPRDGMRMRDLERALRQRAVVLAYVDTDHVAIVHGMDDRHVYIADPSVVRCPGRRQLRRTFQARWDRSGVIIKPREPVECCG